MTLRSAERRIIAALLLLLAAGTGFALAHEGAKGVVKERMDLMKGQAKQMKLIGDMAKGKKKFDAAKAAAAAHDLGLTTKKIPELFPEGSNGHPSEALDAVWKEWDRFKGDAQDAEAAANALAAALRGLRRGLEAFLPEDDGRLQILPRDFPRQGGGRKGRASSLGRALSLVDGLVH